MWWVSEAPLVATLCCLLVTGPGARAEPIAWSYEASAQGDATGAAYVNSQPGPRHGAATVDLLPEGGAGSADILAVGLGLQPGRPAGPRVFFADAAYHLTLKLTDDASHTSGTFTFAGRFDGQAEPGFWAAVGNEFVGPTTQGLTLGQNRYTVTIGPYFPFVFGDAHPGGGYTPPPTPPPGIGAHVDVRPANTPEPPALTLAALGLAWSLLAKALCRLS